MKRLFTALAVFGLVAALGAPALAAELKAGGAIKVKHIITTETASGQFYPTHDLEARRLTTMRANPKLQFLANEYAGFVWNMEMDIDFGDEAYSDTGRGDGGGLAADTVNLETKELYLHFDIPETPVSVRAGVTTPFDSFDNVIYGTADASGFRLLVDLGDTKVNADWFRFWDPTEIGITDDVDFWTLTVSQKLGAASLGGAFYYLKDGSGFQGQGILNQAPGNAAAAAGKGLGYLTRNAATGREALVPLGTAYNLDSYYAGLFGNAMAGPVKIEAWGLYNFGTVEVQGQSDADIRAWAADIRASTKIENIGVSLEGLYVSGQGENDDDAGLVTTNMYQLAGSFYWKHGMMILLPDGDDINNSTALVYDMSNIWENQFLGIFGIFAKASLDLPMNLNAKVGLGWLRSAEDRAVNSENQMGTELNGSLTYTITKGLYAQLNGAYCWTGAFYEVSTADRDRYNLNPRGAATISANDDPDNIYYTSLVFRLAM